MAEFSKERASRYQRAMEDSPRARDAELTQLCNAINRLELPPCDRIVELGAGHGFATPALCAYLKHDGRLLAVDPSPYMAGGIPFLPKVSILVAALADLTVDSGSADLVVSLASFHHVTHKTIVLQEIKRILRPDGVFLIADVYHETPVQIFFDEVARRYCSTGHDFDFLDSQWVGQLAARTGFEHLWTIVAPTDWHFENHAAMLEYVKNLASLEIDHQTLKAFLDRILQPRTQEGAEQVKLPWSLGFHALRRPA